MNAVKDPASVLLQNQCLEESLTCSIRAVDVMSTASIVYCLYEGYATHDL